MVGLLDGAVASAFAAAFGATFLDAEIYRPASGSDDGMGGGADRAFADPEAVKAQLDYVSQAMRGADGFVESDQRILVLASGVAKITTDCEIVVSGTRWSIASVTQDPAGSYYELHGRKKS